MSLCALIVAEAATSGWPRQLAPILTATDTRAFTLAKTSRQSLGPLWKEVQPLRGERQEGSSTSWSSISAREPGWSSRTSTIRTRSDPLDWPLSRFDVRAPHAAGPRCALRSLVKITTKPFGSGASAIISTGM